MKKVKFNAEWQFRRGLDNPMTAVFLGKGADLEEVDLPHDAMISSNRSAENSFDQGIGFFTAENVEYEKTYEVPEEDRGKTIYLGFEGVYGNAVVEINGQVVKRHRFGFTGFTAKISDYLKYGQKNRIKISALNGIRPNGRYYTGTGIYRDVYLMKGSAVHIAPDGVRLTTVEADSEMAVIEAAVKVKNENSGHHRLHIRTVLRGKNEARCETVVNLMSCEETIVRQRIYLRKPQLWSIDHPELYSYETTVEDENGNTDTETGRFGIRTIRLDPERGLRINGETVKLKGGCIHSDNGFIGAVSVPDAENRKIRLLKEAGYNAVRTAHNPVGSSFLDACDKYGMLVMEEFADAWTHPKPVFDYSLWMEECWQEDIESVVRMSYNHPSVVMYSIGNEISDVGTDHSAVWGRKFVEKFKQEDPTRLITNGINIMMANLDKIDRIAADLGLGEIKAGEINNMMAEIGIVMGSLNSHPISRRAIKESCDMLDVVGYNYSADLYEKEHKEMPDRIYLGSETNPGDLDKNWEIVKKNDYVIGDFAWTAWDYIGEPGIGRIEEKKDGFNVYAAYPWMLAYCGDFDLTGYRRPVSYWREIVWGGKSHAPYISVRRPENIGKELYFSQWSWTDSVHSWTFPGQEGKETVVEVYADAEEAELFLNGHSLGRKKAGQEKKRFLFTWELLYEPGMLCAVSYENGVETGVSELYTAKGAKLCVKADRQELAAGSEDLAFIEIEYRDEKDTLDMSVRRTVTIDSEGPIKILGSGTANPRTEERYTDLCHEIYEGRMIAVIRAEKYTGTGIVRIVDDSGEKEVVKFAVR